MSTSLLACSNIIIGATDARMVRCTGEQVLSVSNFKLGCKLEDKSG